MVNFGPLAAQIGLPVWGTPANFNGFHVLAALLHGTLVEGVSQTLRHWTEQWTLYSAVWLYDQELSAKVGYGRLLNAAELIVHVVKSCDPSIWGGGQNNYRFETPSRPQFVYSLYNFYVAWLRPIYRWQWACFHRHPSSSCYRKFRFIT